MSSFLLNETIRNFSRWGRKIIPAKPLIVDGYPNFTSIPKAHRNKRFLTAWLNLDPSKFDQIPEHLVTTEMRAIFCRTDYARLQRFETLPYNEFEELVISIYQQSPIAAFFNPEVLRESFLLATPEYLAFKFVALQTTFHEHLFTQRVFSRLVKSSLKYADYFHQGASRHDDACKNRVRQLIHDEDVLFKFGPPDYIGDFRVIDKEYFHPEDVDWLRRMGKLYLLDKLMGVKQWSFDLEIPTSLDHCFWMMSQRSCDSNRTLIYGAWLRKFPLLDVLSMADKKSSWHRLVMPVYNGSLLKPYFKQFPWLKGHVLEDLLGI